MRVAICDDEPKDRTTIRNFVDTHSAEHKIFEFDSAKPLIKHIDNNENCFDILFLDIQMPEPSGWDLAKQLKLKKNKIYIAMITINENYVQECFDRVDWFAVKPVTENKIHKILKNAYEKLFPLVFEFSLGNNETLVLEAPEIIYFESRNNYVYVNTIDKVYKVRETLKNIMKQCTSGEFASPHRSYLINLDYYKKKDSQILLKNGDTIPLSRHKSKGFFNEMRDYVIRRKSNI